MRWWVCLTIQWRRVSFVNLSAHCSIVWNHGGGHIERLIGRGSMETELCSATMIEYLGLLPFRLFSFFTRRCAMALRAAPKGHIGLSIYQGSRRRGLGFSVLTICAPEMSSFRRNWSVGSLNGPSFPATSDEASLRRWILCAMLGRCVIRSLILYLTQWDNACPQT